MARPTKFNEETSERLLNFISAGFTVTQACKGVNISTDTCSRWRQKDLDFNKRFIEATKSQQWGSAAALAKYGCRTYKRKVRISPDYGPALSQSPAGASQNPFNLEGDKTPASNKPTHYRGFPIRYGNLADDKPFEVCAVARNPEYLAWCEREKGTGRIIEHHCSIDAHLRWLKKQRKQNLYSDDNDLVFGWVF